MRRSHSTSRRKRLLRRTRSLRLSWTRCLHALASITITNSSTEFPTTTSSISRNSEGPACLLLPLFRFKRWRGEIASFLNDGARALMQDCHDARIHLERFNTEKISCKPACAGEVIAAHGHCQQDAITHTDLPRLPISRRDRTRNVSSEADA